MCHCVLASPQGGESCSDAAGVRSWVAGPAAARSHAFGDTEAKQPVAPALLSNKKVGLEGGVDVGRFRNRQNWQICSRRQ